MDEGYEGMQWAIPFVFSIILGIGIGILGIIYLFAWILEIPFDANWKFVYCFLVIDGLFWLVAGIYTVLHKWWIKISMGDDLKPIANVEKKTTIQVD